MRAQIDNLSLCATLAARLDANVSSRAAASDWTATRAGYLDTSVSSRAAASTALSNAQWTNARAGYLDKLNSMPSGGGGIKSVQRGVLDTTNNSYSKKVAYISPVNTSKSIAYITATGRWESGKEEASMGICDQPGIVEFNSDNLQIMMSNQISSPGSTIYIARVWWEVIEFN